MDPNPLRRMVQGLAGRVIAVEGETANPRAQWAPELTAIIAEGRP
jgi:hypothetical protein